MQSNSISVLLIFFSNIREERKAGDCVDRIKEDQCLDGGLQKGWEMRKEPKSLYLMSGYFGLDLIRHFGWGIYVLEIQIKLCRKTSLLDIQTKRKGLRLFTKNVYFCIQIDVLFWFIHNTSRFLTKQIYLFESKESKIRKVPTRFQI